MKVRHCLARALGQVTSGFVFQVLTIWIALAIFSSCVVTSTAGAHRARHGGCNFRIVRDIMRRACAYHSLENSQLFGLDELQPPSNGIAGAGVRSSSYGDDGAELYSHDTAHGSRAKKEMELLYIRRILKECCPNEGCPPLSKFCR